MSVPKESVLKLWSEINDLLEQHHRGITAHVETWLRSQQVPWEDAAASPLAPHRIGDLKVQTIAGGPPTMVLASSARGDCPSPPAMPSPGISIRDLKGQKKTPDKKIRPKSSLGKQVFKPEQEEELIEMTRFQRLVHSRFYEWGTALIIIVNSIWVGWQTQYIAFRSHDAAKQNQPLDLKDPAVFTVVNVLFACWFTVELGMRCLCDGVSYFFRAGEVGWNIFDSVIVVSGMIEAFVDVILSNSNDQPSRLWGRLSVLRVVRVMRLVRLVKGIRTMHFFRELRIMIYAVMGSFKPLMWVCLVLSIIFYIFGILFTRITTVYLNTPKMWYASENQELIANFGTLGKSMLSLFMAMSGGNDWSVYFDALKVIPGAGLPTIFFIIYMTIAAVAVVNVVTGIFVDTALHSHQKDKDVIIDEELRAKCRYLEDLRIVFDEMDADGTGEITLSEFESKLNDDHVIAYFSSLKLDVSDARTLFQLMDFDNSGLVNINEFLHGCYMLQGESRQMDMKIMQCQVRFLREMFLTFHDDLMKLSDDLKAFREEQCSRSRGSQREHIARPRGGRDLFLGACQVSDGYSLNPDVSLDDF